MQWEEKENNHKDKLKDKIKNQNLKTGKGNTNLEDFAASRISLIHTSFGKIWTQ